MALYKKLPHFGSKVDEQGLHVYFSAVSLATSFVALGQYIFYLHNLVLR